MDNPNSAGKQKHDDTPHGGSAKRSSLLPVKPNLEDEISELERELITSAARMEKRGLEYFELAGLQESYTDTTLALEALIKEWEGDHKKSGDSR